VARVILWSVESTRMALDLNRTLLDIGRDMLRRQQDAAIASALQALGRNAGPSGGGSAPDAVSDLVRQSFDTFDRMMAAMRAANMAAPHAANEGTTASAGEPSPEPERRARRAERIVGKRRLPADGLLGPPGCQTRLTMEAA
jgi:hypothetical protein